MEFVQEVNVITGGYMPEYGRSTGGVLNAVTKSGSNEFHGSVFGNWTPGALEGTRKHVVARRAASSPANTTLHNLGDFGADLGGPILKDKLWFYAGVAPSFTRYSVDAHAEPLRLCTAAEIAAGEGRCNRAVAAGGSRITSTTGRVRPGRRAHRGAPEHARFADQRTFQYIGKLTYLVNQDHNLCLSVYGTPTQVGQRRRPTASTRRSGASFQRA